MEPPRDSGLSPDGGRSRGFTAVSVDFKTNCALHSSGTAVCWGYAFQGSPLILGGVREVSVSHEDACAVVGTDIVCIPAPFAARWSGHPRVPRARYAHVATGVNAACGLTEAGTIDCWGWDELEQPELPPPFDERAVRLRMDDTWACAVTESSRAHCWHPHPQGEEIVPLPDGSYIDAASDGSGVHCGVGLDGEIRCASGVCRRDPETLERLPCEPYCGLDACWEEVVGDPPPGPFVKVALGRFGFMCALRPTGELECWGRDYERMRHLQPDVRFTDFGVGTDHVCAVTTDGDVRCWGDFGPEGDDWGQLDPPPWP